MVRKVGYGGWVMKDDERVPVMRGGGGRGEAAGSGRGSGRGRFALKKGVIDMVGVASSAILGRRGLPAAVTSTSSSSSSFSSSSHRCRPPSSSHSLCSPSHPKDILVFPCTEWHSGCVPSLTCPADALGHPFRPTPATSCEGPGGCLSPWRPNPRPTPSTKRRFPIPRHFASLFRHPSSSRASFTLPSSSPKRESFDILRLSLTAFFFFSPCSFYLPFFAPPPSFLHPLCWIAKCQSSFFGVYVVLLLFSSVIFFLSNLRIFVFPASLYARTK